MSVDKMLVVKMSVDKMPVYEMSTDEMIVRYYISILINVYFSLPGLQVSML
jgi:hypothetical protein